MVRFPSWLLGSVVGLIILIGCLWLFWYSHQEDRGHRLEIRKQGCDAARRGVPVEADPWHDRSETKEWREGWIEGFKERQ